MKFFKSQYYLALTPLLIGLIGVFSLGKTINIEKTNKILYVTYETNVGRGSMTIGMEKVSDFPLGRIHELLREKIDGSFFINSVREVSLSDYQEYTESSNNLKGELYERF